MNDFNRLCRRTCSREILKSALLILVVALCVFFFVVFSARDHAWFFQDSCTIDDRLFVMRAGTFCTGCALYLFGCSAVIPVFFLACVFVFRKPFFCSRTRGIERCIGVALLTIAASLECSAFSYEAYAYVDNGGLIGGTLHACILRAGGGEIEYVLCAGLVLIACVLIFGFSWMTPLCRSASYCRRRIARTRIVSLIFSIVRALKKRAAAVLTADERTCSTGGGEDELERCVRTIVSEKSRDL